MPNASNIDDELDSLYGIKRTKTEEPSYLAKIFGAKPKVIEPNIDDELDSLYGIKREVPEKPSVLDNIKESAKGFLNKGFEKIGKNEQILAEGLPQAVNKPLYEPDIEEPKTYPQALKNVAKGFASSLTTPAGMAGMLAGPAGAVALAPTMGIGAYEEGKEAKKAFEEGDNPKALQHGLASAMTAGLPLLALKGGPRDIEPRSLKTLAPKIRNVEPEVIPTPESNIINMGPKGGSLEGLVPLLPEKASPSNTLLPSERQPLGVTQPSGTPELSSIIAYLDRLREEPKEPFVPEVLEKNKLSNGMMKKPSYEGPVPIIGENPIQPELGIESSKPGLFKQPQEKLPIQEIQNAVTQRVQQENNIPEYSGANQVGAPQETSGGNRILGSQEAPQERPIIRQEIAPEIQPEIRTRKLSLGVEEKAIENKLTESLGDLPEYKVVNMKDQAIKASDILKNDLEQARRIAFGEEAPPHGVLPESVFVAVEDHAIKNGDVETLKKLASSGLTGEATVMGQRIRTLAERNPESPVAAIKEIQRIREDSFKRRSLKDINKVKRETINQIRNEITKRAPTKETWASFVESIKC